MAASRSSKGANKNTVSVELPGWEPDFVQRSKSYTRRVSFIRVLGALVVLGLPSAFALWPTINSWFETRPFFAISVFFGVLALLSVLRKIIWRISVSKGVRFFGKVVKQVARICLWGGFCLWWYVLSDSNVFFVILGWWLCGIPFVGFIWLEHKWRLQGAEIVKQNYKLVGIKRIPAGSSRRKLGRLRLYSLPEGAPDGDYTAMVTVSSEPKAYVGSLLMETLSPNQLGAVLAHELGHSLSSEGVVFEVARWGWRLFGLPLALWFMQMIPASAMPYLPGDSVFRFLTLAIVAWLVATWVARILDRRIEVGADFFALKLATGAQDLIDGLEKLALRGRHNVFPNLLDRLGLNSHPCIVSRMKKIRRRMGSG